MKCFSYLLAAVTMLLLVVGCDSPLNYVSEDADFVVYGNTQSFFNSKSWKLIRSSKNIEKALEDFKKAINADDDKEIAGKVALWGMIKDNYPQVSGMVISFDAGNAGKVFKAWEKEVSQSRLVKEKVNDCEAFIVKKYDGETIDFCVVLVDENTLHVTNSNAPQIHEISSNDAAKAIDKSAVFAVALKSLEELEKILGQNAPEMDGVGVAKLEVFADGGEVRANISVDISNVED